MSDLYTIDDITCVLPDFTRNTSQDAIDVSLQSDIDIPRAELARIAREQGYINTDDFGTLTGHQQDLLAGIAWFYSAAKVLDRGGVSANIDWKRWVKAYFRIYKFLSVQFAQDIFHASFRGSRASTLPRILIVTAQEATNQLRLPVLSANTYPTLTAATNWAYRWSAIAYSLGAGNGYPTPNSLSSLTSNQQNLYKELVRLPLAAQIVRTHNAEFSGQGVSVGQDQSDEYFNLGIFNGAQGNKKRFIESEEESIFLRFAHDDYHHTFKPTT